MIMKLSNALPEECIVKDAPMAEYTSFKAGGNADWLVEPQNSEQLSSVLQILAEEGIPHFILGNGSNVLVRDGGYRGVIVRPGDGFRYVRSDGEKLICGCGALMSTVARYAADEELAGFEFASGIPGSIGGAVFMNAGAYGGEMADIIESVELMSPDGKTVRRAVCDQLDMGYRHSALHESGEIVTEVTLKLSAGDGNEIKARMAEMTEKRNSKQPVRYPSAGSFFKRPPGYYAAKLLEDAGCKGLTVGGAQVSEKHSGFIINIGNATASDILKLKDIVTARVMDSFGVAIEPEVRIIGEIEYEMLFDIHTHTTYSHGKGSVEDNVRAAIDKGLEYIAISDHGPGHLFYGINRNDFVNLRNDIEKMNVKYQNIQIRLSVEANTVHGGNGLDLREEEFEEFDFVMAGFHFGLFGCSSVRNWLWSHGIRIGEETLREKNTEMIVGALRKNNISVLTHPGDKGPFDLKRIAEVCAETDTLMEINCRHGHLTADEIREAAEVPGLKFIVSSDAHEPEAVGNFMPGLKRAFEAGLDISRIVNIREKK